jgi:diacylglycerol O-acyltransferase
MIVDDDRPAGPGEEHAAVDRMSPLDAAFLLLEDDGVSHMHVGSLSIFEGPAPPSDEFDAFIAGKLPLVPRYRQKVRVPPLGIGRPAWVDDPNFNLGYHVRHTALARPGGERELRTLVGRVMSQRLDRGKPLWELWTVDGLDEGSWAILTKTHHCMVDGISATDLLTVLLDPAPIPAEAVPDDWRPRPAPGTAAVVLDGLLEAIVDPVKEIRALRATYGTLAEARGLVRGLASGAAGALGLLRPLHRTSLDGAIGPHRRWAWARSSLADVKSIRRELGGTVNDVVLAAVTSGFRTLLEHRGEPCEGRVVRSLVPVSVRRPEERGQYNNRVSAVLADLPVGVEDPVERLRTIMAATTKLKRDGDAIAGEVLAEVSGFAPPALLVAAARVASRVPQRSINTVTTNVPGPQLPLYALGRRMLASFPFVPIQGQVRVGVAIFSYDGQLNFGITGDFDSTPDLDVLTAGIDDGMAQLLKAAARSNPSD